MSPFFLLRVEREIFLEEVGAESVAEEVFPAMLRDCCSFGALNASLYDVLFTGAAPLSVSSGLELGALVSSGVSII